MSQENVIRIPPLHYIHVLDQNSQITRIEGPGPLTFIRQEHEVVKEGPTKMIILNTGKYCKIKNPVQYENNKLVLTEFGQVKNNFGEFEIRTYENYPEPFPLYPGEQLLGMIENQEIILENNAIKVKALRDFFDNQNKVDRIAGQEWLIFGPLVFTPRIEIQVVQKLKPQVINKNQALKLSAINQFVDSKNIKREVGEEWLVREIGNYMPSVDEKVIELVNGQVLTDTVCLCLRAKKNFVDVYNIKRKAGQMWLVTNQTQPENPIHILDVNEEKIYVQQAITLKANEYCKILHPFIEKTQTNDWGKTILRKGEKTFFLLPGEELVGNIEKMRILLDDEVLLLQAILDFKDEEGKVHVAGEKWMIKGPREYIPPIEIKIIEERKCIPLGDNEGIYIRDIKTGKVKKHIGKTYLLQAHEELWDKHLPAEVECLLAEAATGRPFIPPQFAKDYQVSSSKRIKSQIVKYQVQGNNCVQLYDYEKKQDRIVFGPEVIILEPDEMFTVLTLSGGRPKQENQIKTLALNLGPDFMADIIVVETSDHAQLSLQLSYNWHFQIDKSKPEEVAKIFAVKDFVGDICKQIASRVRGAVSGISFEDFHNNSSIKIQEAVFGKNPDGTIKKNLFFKQNNMIVSSVDIQNIEITELKTREYLQKSINQAIEISTRSYEQQSENQAKQLEEEAKGVIEIQVLQDKAKAESSRVKLLEQQTINQSIISKGKAVSVAKAVAEKEKILGEARVKQTTLVQQTEDIKYNQELEEMKAQQQSEYDLKKDEVEFEIQKNKIKAGTETTKFKKMVESIGKDTLISISKAGPELKAKLLKGLGLQGYLVTDGKNPVNLFNTANGFLGSEQK